MLSYKERRRASLDGEGESPERFGEGVEKVIPIMEKKKGSDNDWGLSP